MKSQENGAGVKPIHTLIPLEDFKALMGIDDREDRTARFCLVTAAYSIEQYCKRRLLRKKHCEYIDFFGDRDISLKEYPISKVLAVYALFPIRPSEIIEPELYQVIPDYGTDIDIPYRLCFSPALKGYGRLTAVKAVYWAGYTVGKVPADLASACVELAAWNMNRYRGRRIGMTGNVRGSGKDGEHFEISMPEQVRQLLEPYRRKTI